MPSFFLSESRPQVAFGIAIWGTHNAWSVGIDHPQKHLYSDLHGISQYRRIYGKKKFHSTEFWIKRFRKSLAVTFTRASHFINAGSMRWAKGGVVTEPVWSQVTPLLCYQFAWLLEMFETLIIFTSECLALFKLVYPPSYGSSRAASRTATPSMEPRWYAHTRERQVRAVFATSRPLLVALLFMSMNVR